MMPVASPHEEDQGQEGQKEDSQDPVVIAEGQHLGLALHFPVEARQGQGVLPELPGLTHPREDLAHPGLPLMEG